jgi:hypothetical protein
MREQWDEVSRAHVGRSPAAQKLTP